MVSIGLFAIIGATITPGAGYWVLFTLYCIGAFARILAERLKD